MKAGLVYGVGSEDMDTLTFGSPILLRHLTASEAKKLPITEISLLAALEGLGISMDSFVDLCILLGCDYCESIKGIGPQKAVKLIQEYGTLETILENLDKTKYSVPEPWPIVEVRRLFVNPAVTEKDEVMAILKWTVPQEEALVIFASVASKDYLRIDD